MINPKQKEAHIIHHTHWDREWFLTHIYTTEWIPGLIKKIEALSNKDPNFKYLLDGQTLIVEDLMTLRPDFKSKVEKLVKSGNLIIGPYYCQPDWRIVKGESLIRNLEIGREIMEEFGAAANFGWVVDTFGQISQSPQIHKLFGIGEIYIWRGVPTLDTYFSWIGADGSRLLALFLIGGYRNLYGVTLFPELAVGKLKKEIKTLVKYYETNQIPLFDGYDLEFNPKNTARFFLDISYELEKQGIKVVSSDPQKFIDSTKNQVKGISEIKGELLSGRYYSAFPGTLSARTYLKILNNDIEKIMYRIYEPLTVIAAKFGIKSNLKKHRQNLKELLTNQIHDPICGVSIDLVHERMEYSYRKLYDHYKEEIQYLLGNISSELEKGIYYYSINPFKSETWISLRKKLWRIRSEGIGIGKIGESIEIDYEEQEISDSFVWSNEHYTVQVNQNGELLLGSMRLGYFEFHEDYGDSYSGESSGQGFRIYPHLKPKIIEKSEKHIAISFKCEFEKKGREIDLDVKVFMDPSPIIKWMVEIDSIGVDFNINAVFDLAENYDSLQVGMPFDIVHRSCEDTNLLPREVSSELKRILLGQRDLIKINKFPFHDFIVLSKDKTVKVVFARGIREYQADKGGKVRITLRRSTEWMAKQNLEHRLGDAASIMYIPEARCERRVVHRLGFALLNKQGYDLDLYRLNESFQNEPIIFENHNSGRLRKVELLKWNLPITTIFTKNKQFFFRTFNPTSEVIQPAEMANKFEAVDTLTKRLLFLKTIRPKQICTIKFLLSGQKKSDGLYQSIDLLAFPEWRIGKNKSFPNEIILSKLRKKVKSLEMELENIEKQLQNLKGKKYHQTKHKLFIKEREKAETELILALIKLKQQNKGNPTKYLFEVDPVIRKLARYKNLTRINRRVYDHLAVLFND